MQEKENPFLKRAIIDFFKKNNDLEVLISPVSSKDNILRINFIKKSAKKHLSDILRNNPPLEKWAEEFVACDFILTNDRWRYYGGMFAIVNNEEGLGE